VVPEDLLLEVPREHVIRVWWFDLIFQLNGYVHAWRQKTHSKGILFNQAFDKFRPDAEIIQKRVSFDRRSEAKYAPALRALSLEKIEALFFLLKNVMREAAIRPQLVTA